MYESAAQHYETNMSNVKSNFSETGSVKALNFFGNYEIDTNTI